MRFKTKIRAQKRELIKNISFDPFLDKEKRCDLCALFKSIRQTEVSVKETNEEHKNSHERVKE
jgi:hypothetical protein